MDLLLSHDNGINRLLPIIRDLYGHRVFTIYPICCCAVLDNGLADLDLDGSISIGRGSRDLVRAIARSRGIGDGLPIKRRGKRQGANSKGRQLTVGSYSPTFRTEKGK